MIEEIKLEEWQEKIIIEARSWIGTPFGYGCIEKGKGTDCARFILETFKACGYVRPGHQLKHIPPDWFMAPEEIAKDFEKQFVGELMKLSFEIPIKERRPTDILLMEYSGSNGLKYKSHLGIYLPAEEMIHARNQRKVQVQSVSNFMPNIVAVLRCNGLPV